MNSNDAESPFKNRILVLGLFLMGSAFGVLGFQNCAANDQSSLPAASAGGVTGGPMAAEAFPPPGQSLEPFDMITLIEYRNVENGRFFIANQDEEASMASKGMVATGTSFTFYETEILKSFPVIRFYSTATASYVYVVKANELALLRAAGSGFQEDGIVAYAKLPKLTGATEACTPDVAPVYRSYRDIAGSNADNIHRYTSQTIAVSMTGAGWKNEGIAFCVPAFTLTNTIPVVAKKLANVVTATGFKTVFADKGEKFIFTASAAEASALQNYSSPTNAFTLDSALSANSNLDLFKSGAAGTVAAVRYFIPATSSHFYTISSAEIAALDGANASNPGTYVKENPEFAGFPVGALGCPIGTRSVYRLFYDGPAHGLAVGTSRHRFTASANEKQSKVGAGYSFEQVAFCSPDMR